MTLQIALDVLRCQIWSAQCIGRYMYTDVPIYTDRCLYLQSNFFKINVLQRITHYYCNSKQQNGIHSTSKRISSDYYLNLFTTGCGSLKTARDNQTCVMCGSHPTYCIDEIKHLQLLDTTYFQSLRLLTFQALDTRQIATFLYLNQIWENRILT